MNSTGKQDNIGQSSKNLLETVGQTVNRKEQLEKLDLSEFDKEPDYVFIVKKYGAAFLIEELVALNLIVKEFKCKITVIIKLHFRLGK